jgi:hypothetical protein
VSFVQISCAFAVVGEFGDSILGGGLTFDLYEDLVQLQTLGRTGVDSLGGGVGVCEVCEVCEVVVPFVCKRFFVRQFGPNTFVFVCVVASLLCLDHA